MFFIIIVLLDLSFLLSIIINFDFSDLDYETLAACTLLHFTVTLKKDFIEMWISFGLIKYS